MRYCSRSGDQKARVVALRLGESIVVPTRAEACVLRKAAANLGMRLSVRCIARGQPAQRVSVK